MSNTINLSIVIPTYNRAEYLEYLVDSIVSDLKEWPNDFELIISDNASNDGTKPMISEFINKRAPIKYIINEVNMGADGNISSCFQLANGKYVWVIGDDEILYRGTIQYVLELCRTQQFGILHLSSRGFHDGEQDAIKLLTKPDKVIIEILTPEKFFRITNIFLTFISANIVNKEIIMKRHPNFKAEIELLNNTSLTQLSWIYSAIKEEDVNLYIRTPLFGALGGNTSGYKLVQVFGYNLLDITNKYFKDFYPKATQIMSNAVATRLLPGELLSQAGDIKQKNKFEDENLYEATKNCFKGSLYFHLFIKPFFSGSPLIRKIAWFYVRVFNKLNQKLGYFLL